MHPSKQRFSGLRYFKAGLRPFGRFIFWGPPTLVAVFLFALWQYRTHPEWLATSNEQPEGSIENLFGEANQNSDTLLDSTNSDPLANSELNELADSKLLDRGLTDSSPAENSSDSLLEQLNGSSPLTSLLGGSTDSKTSGSLNDSSKLNKDLGKTTKNQLPDIFMPLFPSVKSNAQEDDATPKSVGTPQSTAVVESALQKAMDRLVSPQTEIPPLGVNSVESQVTVPPTSDGGQASNEAQVPANPQSVNPQTVQPAPAVPVQTYQQPSNPYAVQPPQIQQPAYNPYPTAQQTQPTPTQTYQQPAYNPYPVYNPYPAAQQVQPPQTQQPNQSTNNNNNNNLGIQTPQFQEPIDVYQPGY